MPIYEYACKQCGHSLDALQKMNDDPLLDCPDCGEPQLKRLISAPRFRLKGKGWYETDFKKDNQRNLSSGDADPAKSGEDKSKSDSTSDKQPEKSANGSKPTGDVSSGKASNTNKASTSKGSD